MDAGSGAVGQPAGVSGTSGDTSSSGTGKKKARRRADSSSQKRRCISTACIACRKRKSKCDGALPSCAACASVYGTECIYDPNSDHRRKGVYKEKADSFRARDTTLQVLLEAILNASEDDVQGIVGKIRSTDDLDTVAEELLHDAEDSGQATPEDIVQGIMQDSSVEGEQELARKMGELRFEDGSVRYIGGTSHLIYLGGSLRDDEECAQGDRPLSGGDPATSWTQVTTDRPLISHLINMYFNYHYAYFTALSRKLFFRDFLRGSSEVASQTTTSYCSALLVNAMLALGCHFTDVAGAYGTPGDSKTKGDHFFAEAKRLILENDDFARPRLVTVQALALMSVREAGCGREAKGWVYSGMSFRMALDIGLNLDLSNPGSGDLSEEEIDARKITFWGCFVFDKCWSNYLGRLPQLPKSVSSVSKFDVFPDEDASSWSPLTDKGFNGSFEQPWRTRAAALQLVSLCEISSDLLVFFYHPSHLGRSRGKSAELKKLSEIHQRLEHWRKALPAEFEPKDGQLPNVILIHMFFHLQYIHLFRPFLKYAPKASPLPAHVSPRRICTANAGAISKLMRLYKRTYGLRQICNIAVYMTHSACTIHLLNLPDKSARRDIIHGVKHLEEVADDWPCARRTLTILSVLSKKWTCELPDEAAVVLKRADEKYGSYSMSDVPSPKSSPAPSMPSDEGSGNKSSREFTPLDHIHPGHTPCTGLTTSTMADESYASMDSQIFMADDDRSKRLGHQRQQPQPQTALRLDGLQTAFNTSAAVPTWNVQQQAASTTAPFPINRAPMAQRATDQQGNTRQASFGPMRGVSMTTGQDWMLNDSARWEHNFQGWVLGEGAGGGGGGGGGVQAPDVFLFGSNGGGVEPPLCEADNMLDEQALDTLAASAGPGGWLSGLE